MDRRSKALEGLRLDGLGLEIGAGFGPLAAGDPSLRVRTLDHLDQEGLKAKYAALDTSRILPVDYVWSGERYLDLVGDTRFDWILASHVIEHVPDLVGFINECGEILTDGGVLTLIVPDKRREFDLYRPPSGLGGIVDAHLQGRRLSSPGLAAEFALYIAKLEGRDIWTSEERGSPTFEYGVGMAKALMERCRSGAYADIHAWVFTPHSFRLIVEDLHALGLISLRERRFHATEDHEFFIQLSADGAGPDLDRIEACRRALLELPEAVLPPPEPQELPCAMVPEATAVALEQENAALRAALAEIRASTSWRLTAPLRRLRGGR